MSEADKTILISFVAASAVGSVSAAIAYAIFWMSH